VIRIIPSSGRALIVVGRYDATRHWFRVVRHAVARFPAQVKRA
jgi:hypothetical protein